MKKIIVLTTFMLFILFGCETETTGNVDKVESLSEMAVYAETPFSALDLPETLTVTLTDDTTITVQVSWDETSYNKLASGIIEGTLTHETIEPFTVTYPYRIIQKSLMTIFEDNFSIFNEALYVSEVNTILDLEGPYTVFAPTDEAFHALFDALSITKDDFLERDDLADLLLYHILSGNYTNNVLIASVPGELSALDGNMVNVRLQGAKLQLNNQTVIQNTYEADNGLIHAIDSVLISEDTAESIIGDLFDEDFLSIFSELFSDLDIPLDVLLEGSLTVFIPSEDALNLFLEANAISMDDFMVDEGLIDLLSYHVFAGQYLADELYNDAPINIRNIRDDLVRVDVIDGQLTVGGAIVESTETLGNLALVHIIDRVLIPPELVEQWRNTIE